MHAVVQKLLAGSREGLNDTQIEFGALLSISPIQVKLDQDPIPLEEEELAVLRSANLKIEDVGKKVALMHCTNGQYLLVGVVD